MLEILETRFVPAGVFTFTDVDGDLVKLTSSLGTDADLLGATKFLGNQLRTLDLTSAIFQGADITASVIKKGPIGDGLINIGWIKADGRDLGAVSVSGDLGNIDCGDTTYSTTALKSLKVRSLGMFGLATQGGTGDLESNIYGGLGKLTVECNVVGATIFVNGAQDGILGSVFVGGSILGGLTDNSGQISTTGTMGPVTILGDLVGGTGFLSGAIYANDGLAGITIGGSVVGGTQVSSGSIVSSGNIGPVKIGGDLAGGIGIASGRILGVNITSVNIGGSMLGGDGFESGSIVTEGSIGPVSIGGNVKGNGMESGRIDSAGTIASVKIGGSLLGGSSAGSGSIVSDGAIGPVTILHDVKGGAGSDSGKIDAAGNIGNTTIGGSLLGGSGHQNVASSVHRGQIFTGGSLGFVKIGGNVLGGAGSYSGSIACKGDLAGVSIGGSLIGGKGQSSAVIFNIDSAKIGPVSIRHDIRGGEGDYSACIGSNGVFGNITIGGSLIGGAGSGSGTISSDTDSAATVTIGHDLVGGSGDFTGVISSALDVKIGGSLIGGTGQSSGGLIAYNQGFRTVSIGHDLLGGSIPGQHDALDGSGFIESTAGIGSIYIGGSIVSGTDGSGGVEGLTRNATIRAGSQIGSLTVRGDIVGNVTPAGDSPVIISAVGNNAASGDAPDVAIGKITLGGRVEWAQILAGYDRELKPANADAQIGAVSVGADWIASSLVAGAVNLGADGAPGGTGANADNVNFGDEGDRKITELADLPNVISSIGSITIAGEVFGTPYSARPLDQFGFVAEEIGAVKIGARTIALTAGIGNDGQPVNSRPDLLGGGPNIHEIGSNIGFTIPINASAKLVSASTVTYLDKDGDKITVTFSKPLLTAGNVNDVFHFDTGMVNDGMDAAQQLRYLDLRPLQANGLGVTFTVVRGATGDGLVHVGAIESTGYDVGTVTVPGDLGFISAGDAVLMTPGLASLNVRTLGRFGLDTQGPATMGFTPSIESYLIGNLGSLNVRQDIAAASVNSSGFIGSIIIGGSLIGGDAADIGVIKADLGIGAIQIGHHLQGGPGQGSGLIYGATSGIKSAKIGGSVLGAGGSDSGSLFGGVTGSLKVGHNVRGGTNTNSGALGVENGATVTIGGSLIGGYGEFGARLVSEGKIGAVKIGHNILGGADHTALISGSNISSVTIGGSLIGGGERGGSVFASGKLGSVSIGHDMQGGGGLESGKIKTEQSLTSVKIGGSLAGGIGGSGGSIETVANATTVSIGGDVLGGMGGSSGSIFIGGKFGTLSVHGSLLGGVGITSGVIGSSAGLGSATLGGNVLGGDGSNTGYVHFTGNVKSVTVGGSLVGTKGSTAFLAINGNAGSVKIGGDVIGANAAASGVVVVEKKINMLTIDGSLVGANASGTGFIMVGDSGTMKITRNIFGGSVVGTGGSIDSSGYISSEHRIASLTVGGSLFAGWDLSSTGSLVKNTSVRAGDDIGSLLVKGSLHGHATSEGLSNVVISARGQATPMGEKNVAIGSLRVGGSVERANIFGGYKTDLTPGSTLVQINSVAVGGDWIASNVVAGIENYGADDNPGGAGANADNVNFGDAHDTSLGTGSLANRIAKIVIGGIVAGTDVPGDHFGFSSLTIGSFKSLNFTAPLTKGRNVIELSPATGDVTVREV